MQPRRMSPARRCLAPDCQISGNASAVAPARSERHCRKLDHRIARPPSTAGHTTCRKVGSTVNDTDLAGHVRRIPRGANRRCFLSTTRNVRSDRRAPDADRSHPGRAVDSLLAVAGSTRLHLPDEPRAHRQPQLGPPAARRTALGRPIPRALVVASLDTGWTQQNFVAQLQHQ